MAKIVNAYLDLAELRASDHIPMTMEDCVEQFDMVVRLTRREILTPAGSISAAIAKQHDEAEFEKYRMKMDRLFESDFDRFMLTEDDTNGDDHE